MSNLVRAIYFSVWFVVVLVTCALMGVLPSLAFALWFAVFYLTLALPVRTLRLTAFAVFFFVGLLLVSHATLVVQLIVGVVLPPMYSNAGAFAHYVLLAPISEEAAKLGSLVLVLLVWKWTGARIAFGATDLMLVGLAIGIGLNLFEDMFMVNAPIRTPGLLTNIFVPWTEMQVTRGRPDIVTLNHAASTAFIGLALGWSRYLPKLVRYLPVLGVWLWMIWGHALYNGQDLLERGNIVFFTAPLTWITPWVFFLAVLATIVFEWFVLHRRVTGIEKNYHQQLWQTLRSGFSLQRILPSLREHNLLRHLAYTRVWLRAYPSDRAKSEKYLHQLVTNLDNATIR